MGFESYRGEVSNELREMADDSMTNLVLKYEELLKEKLNTPPPRTGRPYGSHIASAPGESPAPWTEDLLKSVDHVIDTSRSKFHGIVYSDKKKAVWLEFGTGERYTKAGRYTGKILPRPAWRRPLLEDKGELTQALLKGLRGDFNA